jgi:hypothetical protein
MLGSRALPLPLLVGRLRVAHSPQYACIHVSFKIPRSMLGKQGFTYVTASLDDPNLLLHLVLCNSQLVAHHFLVFRRTAREALCGRRRWFVFGCCWLHNAETHVESSHLVIHHDIGYGNGSWCPSLAARLLPCSALPRSLYLLFELHSMCMGSVMTTPSRKSMSHDNQHQRTGSELGALGHGRGYVAQDGRCPGRHHHLEGVRGCRFHCQP